MRNTGEPEQVVLSHGADCIWLRVIMIAWVLNMCNHLNWYEIRNFSPYLSSVCVVAQIQEKFYACVFRELSICRGFLHVWFPCMNFLFYTVRFPQLRSTPSLFSLRFHTRLGSTYPFTDAMLNSIPVPSAVTSYLRFHIHRHIPFLFCILSSQRT
jgi:hypothetical protein